MGTGGEREPMAKRPKKGFIVKCPNIDEDRREKRANMSAISKIDFELFIV